MKSWEQFLKDNSPRCYHTVIAGSADKDDLRVSLNGDLYRKIQSNAIADFKEQIAVLEAKVSLEGYRSLGAQVASALDERDFYKAEWEHAKEQLSALEQDKKRLRESLLNIKLYCEGDISYNSTDICNINRMVNTALKTHDGKE